MNATLDTVQGPVLRPGHDGYDEECSGFQIAGPHRPGLVVGATGPDDVIAAVVHAARHELPLAVQATGHGRAIPLACGVLVSTRRMTGVRIDPATRTARIEAGVRWQQVVDAAAEHGLAPHSGSSPDVGAVGYTLGGGLGLLGRRYGWATDHVRSIDLVTADGRLRHVTADTEPDLFRALRGGGGGLGVVTAMEIGLVPVTRLYGGSLLVDGPHVPALLQAYREWTAGLPDELTSSVALVRLPDLPEVPEPLRGRYTGSVRIAHLGPAAEGERLVAPLRGAVPLLRDTLAEIPFTGSAAIHADPRQPHPYAGTNALLGELAPEVLRAAVEIAGPDAPAMCVVQLNHLGGALARPPAVPGTVGHRDAPFLLRALSPLDGSGDTVHDRLMAAVAGWTVGRSRNFLFGRLSATQVADAYTPEDLEFLAKLRADLDPAGTFGG